MKVKAKHEIHEHVLDEFDNQHLTPGQIYIVVGINFDDFRVLNDAGEPILYSKNLFEVIDSCIPITWVRREYAPDEYYLDPPELSEPGFYEDYYDGKPEAVAAFNDYMRRCDKVCDEE